ncbi:MAG: hypothetical protein P1S59_12500 [bacterium]|nr:hypothetical protein [bacterium]
MDHNSPAGDTAGGAIFVQFLGPGKNHLENKGIRVVLTGGSCVSIYSNNKYQSMDLDLVEGDSGGQDSGILGVRAGI